jgi:hypothetical protein
MAFPVVVARRRRGRRDAQFRERDAADKAGFRQTAQPSTGAGEPGAAAQFLREWWNSVRFQDISGVSAWHKCHGRGQLSGARAEKDTVC